MGAEFQNVESSLQIINTRYVDYSIPDINIESDNDYKDTSYICAYAHNNYIIGLKVWMPSVLLHDIFDLLA